MEFNVEGRLFYNTPIDQYLAWPDLPLSCLYFWTMESAIPGFYELVLLCSVPIIGPDGEVLGVCGFEISAMNFSYTHAPYLNMYPHIASLFIILDNGGFHFENGFSAGNYTPQPVLVRVSGYPPGLVLYHLRDKVSLVGGWGRVGYTKNFSCIPTVHHS
jgi:hypothetical protein